VWSVQERWSMASSTPAEGVPYPIRARVTLHAPVETITKRVPVTVPVVDSAGFKANRAGEKS